jgi:hypothetical protein
LRELRAKSPLVPLYERGSDELWAEGKLGRPTACGAKSPLLPLYERGSDEVRAVVKRGMPLASPFIKGD